MKYFWIFLCGVSFLIADSNMNVPGTKLSVQNRLLTKINDLSISVIDVMKKMDVVLHQSYPQYLDSEQARFGFYSNSWRPIFMEMIDTELMLADAQEREVKLSDGEVREELENRFGPNTMATLDKIGLSFDEAWKMIHNELIVRRMMWFFVHAKALQSVSPQEIRNAYQQHLVKNPPFCEWTYRVVSIRLENDDPKNIEEIYQLFTQSGNSPEAVDLQEWDKSHPGIKIQVSNEFRSKDQELSDSHRTVLTSLQQKTYSPPQSQISRSDNKTVYRMFYLSEKTDHPAPTFESMAGTLKDELVQQSTAKESNNYLQKLRKHYGYDQLRIKETVPDDLQPFHLE